MKWLFIIVGSLVALIALFWLIGLLLPQGHVASRMARYKQPPEKIWQTITDIEGMPAWRKDVKGIKRLPDRNGMPAWVETSGSGEMPLEVIEWNPPRRMVGKIADPKLPFGGTWTYEIEPVEGGSTLRITEHGEIYPALFRFMARFFFGYASTMEQYLKALGTKFGETVEPQG